MPFTGQLGTADSWLGNIVLGFGGAATSSLPVLTATYSQANNTVTLTLHSSDSSRPNGSIELSDDNSTWFTLTGAGNLTINPGTATVTDGGAPANATRYYRARSWDNAQQFYSAYVFASITTPPLAATAMFVLSNPVTGARINPHVVRGSLITQFTEQLTEHQPLGRPSPLVVADVFPLEDGSISFWTTDPNEENALMALITSQATLLLQSPDGGQWYLRITGGRNTTQPYLVGTNTYHQHDLIWRGQPPPA